jgi:flagellar protein FlaJ
MYGPALQNLPYLTFLQDIPYPLFFIFVLPPIITLFMGYAFPKIKATNRSAALEVEVPYAAAYVSVMSTGGLSPYRSLSRLKYMDLLPELSKAASKMDLQIQVLGQDPITAIETLARSTPSKEYMDLLMGYSSTLSAGGDVLHYLRSKTETLFRDRLTKIKAVGERMALLLEIYIAFAVLLALGIYMMFIVARIMPAGAQMPTAFGQGQFFMFGYILFPVMSVFFLYLADMFQPSYPSGEWRPYYAFAACLPLMIYLMFGMFITWYLPEGMIRNHIAFSYLGDFTIAVRDWMGLESGFESGIGLALAFIISTIPAAITDWWTGRGAKEIESGITSFIRDLVEVRKTGMSPERSVMDLSRRDYGRLSPILDDMAHRLGWGFTFRKVYEVFRDQVRSWLARINIFLLYEATEVGGGSPETLESLAHFSETMQSIEKEKGMTLAPLLIVPYIGGIILIASTLLLLSFTRSMLSISGAGIAYVPILNLFTPPLMIHAFLSGLVAGKISAGRISAGFKHAIFLLILSLVAAYLSPMLSLSLQIT